MPNRQVRNLYSYQFVTSCRARRERAEFQKHDEIITSDSNVYHQTELRGVLYTGRWSQIQRRFSNTFTCIEDLSSSNPSFQDSIVDLSSMEHAFLMPRCVRRIEVLKAMKLCKCGLDPEHIFYGGEVWLKKIFSRIIAVPVCLRCHTPCVQRKCNNPLQWKTTLPLW